MLCRYTKNPTSLLKLFLQKGWDFKIFIPLGFRVKKLLTAGLNSSFILRKSAEPYNAHAEVFPTSHLKAYLKIPYTVF